MLRLAFRAIRSNKRRFVGTALSVVLGIAFLSGTFVFTDTIQRSFDDMFAGIYGETDTMVRSSTTLDLGGYEQRGRMPVDVVAAVASVPGVADAQPFVGGYAQVVGADGSIIGDPGRGAPTLGMSSITGALDAWQLTDGSRDPAPGEVVLDRGTAEKGGYDLGDTVTILTQTGTHTFTLVGTATFGSVDSPGGASTSIFDLTTAQDVLLGNRDELDAVLVDAEPGVDQATLTQRIVRGLPDGVEAITGAELVAETQDQMHEAFGFFNTFMLVFAFIGLVVACFTIYNTFQIVVSQRAREMALLRAVGATRRQVLSAQLLESVLLGVVASVVGLGGGFLVARGLKAMLAGFGIDVPGGGTVLLLRTVVVALVVGLVVTAGAAVLPSLRASRIPPIAAVREVAIEQRVGGTARLVRGGLVGALGVGGFVLGLGGHGLVWVGLGALLTLVGAFVLGPLVARPIVRALALPLGPAVGVTGALARENAMRSPRRTARTGGALMVGVALVAAITVIAASVKDWTRDIVGERFTGDFVVDTNTMGFGGVSPQLATDLAALPEIDVATGIRLGVAHDVSDGSDGSDTMYVAVDPAQAGQIFDIGVQQGSIDHVTDDGIFVDDDVATERHLVLGDMIRFGFLDGTVRDLRVEGVYTNDEIAGPFVVSDALHESTGVDQLDASVFIATAPGVGVAAARRAIESVTAAYPNVDVESRDEYIEAEGSQLDTIVNLMYGLLGLAIVIALFSIANSVSLAVHERTHELGLLRAVGMTRHQTGSAVRWEAALIATLGSSIGAALGVFFGWAISIAVRDQGPTAFALPIVPVVVIVGIAVLGGTLAAVRPAWRAGRLDVLRAIASQ